MNLDQKTLFIAAAAVVFLMLLFPPFQHVDSKGIVHNLGYGFLLSPPIYPYGKLAGKVNIALLITQWLAVVLVVVAGYFVLKGNKSGAA